MNRKTMRLVLEVFAFVTVVVAFSVVASQTPDLDPAKLAPHIYQIELENEHGGFSESRRGTVKHLRYTRIQIAFWCT